MNKKVVSGILLIVFVSLLILKLYNSDKKISSTPNSTHVSTKSIAAESELNSQTETTEAFRNHTFKFSKHALCRMDCRHITREEIEEVVHHGKINFHKSDLNAAECPRYALEENVDDKKVRVIVGDCEEKAIIITVIDLDNEFECHCPGDEHK